MRKTFVATTAAIAVTAGALTVPATHAAEPTTATTTSPAKAQPQTREDEPSTLEIVGAIVGSLAFVAVAAGGACWAMQKGFIPNPAPKLIPCNPAPKSAPAPAPAPAPRPAPAAKTYPNCRAVWNDLGGPIHRGDAGYGPHLDRDGDGVGCEKRPK